MSQYAPNIPSVNSVDFLRIQREKTGEDRYPLGRFNFRSLINFGKRGTEVTEKVTEIQEANGVILNDPKYIINASDKLNTFQILDANKVSTPQVLGVLSAVGSYKLHIFFHNNPDGQLVIKPRVGSGGEGMTVCTKASEVTKFSDTLTSGEKEKYFVQEVIQPQLSRNYEFRISVSPWLIGKILPWQEGNWLAQSGVITMTRKRMRQEAADNGEFGRNLALGNSFFQQFDTLTERFDSRQMGWAISLAQRAVYLCGLDFGAVDMIYDSQADQWYVLEINTAPSLTNREGQVGTTGERWMAALPQMLKIKKQYS